MKFIRFKTIEKTVTQYVDGGGICEGFGAFDGSGIGYGCGSGVDVTNVMSGESHCGNGKDGLEIEWYENNQV